MAARIAARTVARLSRALGELQRRFRMAVLGPFLVAGANFIFALVLIPRLGQAEYGYFGYSLVVIQLSFNISNAVAATPLAVELGTHDNPLQAPVGKYVHVSWLVSLLFATLVSGSGIWLGIERIPCLLMGLFAALAAFRWFGRSLALAQMQATKTTASDAVYAAGLLFGAIAFHFGASSSLTVAAVILVTVTVLATIVVFWRSASLLATALWTPPMAYFSTWKEQGSWGVLQVLLMEATANAHVYIVTALKGPESYAIIAVATLFWRPLSTVISSVAQFERPRIARQLGSRNVAGLADTMQSFSVILSLAYGLNLLVIVVVCLFFLASFLPGEYLMSEVVLAVLLCSLTMGARAMRLPSTVYCQAAGELRRLAYVGIVSAPVSLVVATLILVLTGNPVLSLIGVVGGEVAQMLATRRLRARVSRK